MKSNYGDLYSLYRKYITGKISKSLVWDEESGFMKTTPIRKSSSVLKEKDKERIS